MYYYQHLLIADTQQPKPTPFVKMPATAVNLDSSFKPATEPAAAPKPCCVCKDEKAQRDECMLFSTAADPQKDCASTVDQYKSCMASFGFKL